MTSAAHLAMCSERHVSIQCQVSEAEFGGVGSGSSCASREQWSPAAPAAVVVEWTWATMEWSGVEYGSMAQQWNQRSVQS